MAAAANAEGWAVMQVATDVQRQQDRTYFERNEANEKVNLPALPGVRQFGICDNRVQYGHWIDVPAIHRTLILGTVNIHPFDAPVIADPRAATIAYMYAICRLSEEDIATDANVFALAGAEVLAPMIPNDMLAPEAEARLTLVRAVVYALRNNVYAGFSACTAVQYIAAFRQAAPAQEGVQAVIAGPMRRNFPELTQGMPATLPELNVAGFQLTPQNAMALLIFWAEQPTLSYTGLTLLTTTYVAVAKRGQISARAIRKIVNGVRDDVQANITLNAMAVRNLYQRFLIRVDASNIVRILRRWEDMLPHEALRLRLTLQQTEWAGLTVLNIIREAMMAFPSFNWGIIAELFPAEATALTVAFRLVNGDPYFGFNHDLGEVKSTNYKFYGWVAKELLVQGEGRDSLAQYAGWPMIVPHEATLRRMILQYLARRAPGANAGGEAAATAGILMAVANPAVEANVQAYVDQWAGVIHVHDEAEELVEGEVDE